MLSHVTMKLLEAV